MDLAYCLQIFFTGNDPRAGEEEKFPSPDNASKMRRSVENAEHVGTIQTSTPVILSDCSIGLFAPRAGQHYRDEQRRRRSRYDRGTRLAALEEYDYEEYYSAEQSFQGQYAGRFILNSSFVLDYSQIAKSNTGLHQVAFYATSRNLHGDHNLIEALRS